MSKQSPCRECLQFLGKSLKDKRKLYKPKWQSWSKELRGNFYDLSTDERVPSWLNLKRDEILESERSYFEKNVVLNQLRYDDSTGLGEACDWVKRFLWYRKTHQFMHVMVRAGNYGSFEKILSKYKNHVYVLPFSCLCDGDVEKWQKYLFMNPATIKDEMDCESGSETNSLDMLEMESFLIENEKLRRKAMTEPETFNEDDSSEYESLDVDSEKERYMFDGKNLSDYEDCRNPEDIINEIIPKKSKNRDAELERLFSFHKHMIIAIKDNFDFKRVVSDELAPFHYGKSARRYLLREIKTPSHFVNSIVNVGIPHSQCGDPASDYLETGQRHHYIKTPVIPHAIWWLAMLAPGLLEYVAQFKHIPNNRIEDKIKIGDNWFAPISELNVKNCVLRMCPPGMEMIHIMVMNLNYLRDDCTHFVFWFHETVFPVMFNEGKASLWTDYEAYAKDCVKRKVNVILDLTRKNSIVLGI